MKPRLWTLVLLDAAIAAASVLVAYRLRFDATVLPDFLAGAARVAPLAAALVPVSFALLQIYRQPMPLRWPLRIIAGSGLALTIAALVTFATGGFDRISRLSFAAAALLIVLGCAGYRGLFRIRALVRARRDAQPGFDDLVEQDRSIGLNLLRLWSYRELVRNLVLKDLRLKYRGSALGFVWSLANPILMLTVYSLAFTYILGIRREGFVYFLLLGMLAWTFFASTTSMATGSVVESGGLLRSVRFPRTVLPVATVLFNLAQYLLTFGVLLPIMLVIFGVTPSITMLAYPAILLLMVLFTTGVALMVAAATAFYRDAKHLVEIALAAMFWMTPIVYDLSDAPERMRLPILLTPMSPFVTALHDVFYHRVWPDASIWVGALAWTTAAFIGGVSIFLSFEDRFAERV